MGKCSNAFFSETTNIFMPIGNPRWLPPQVIVLTPDHIGENTEISSSLKLVH
jgi:hypothetical protein